MFNWLLDNARTSMNQWMPKDPRIADRHPPRGIRYIAKVIERRENNFCYLQPVRRRESTRPSRSHVHDNLTTTSWTMFATFGGVYDGARFWAIIDIRQSKDLSFHARVYSPWELRSWLHEKPWDAKIDRMRDVCRFRKRRRSRDIPT